MQRLARILDRLDGKPYKAYKDLQGEVFRWPDYNLRFLHVQGDPFAAPSRLSLTFDPEAHRLPEALWATADRRRATADYLQRRLFVALHRQARGRGSGRSGELAVARPGQAVLWRTGVRLGTDGSLELRPSVGLPAVGRRILGGEARRLLLQALPAAVAEAVPAVAEDPEPLWAHVRCVEDQVALRAWLAAHGFVAFVGDGAVLPRRSGIDDRPLTEGAVPFDAPDTLAEEVTLPHAGLVRGMAVPAGVTVVVGGGFHGKTTLLQALERGVYDHIPGDGRERVVTLAEAVKVRAEDGRAIHPLDIRPFIDHLPLGRDTRRFATDNASGSTSQAAAILEALDMGARLLLVDEDTAATNLMIRDARMQAVVHPDKEPIAPFIARVRELHERLGVSTLLVMGGSGDYFAVADTVLMMDEYRPRDVTAQAREAAAGITVPEAGPRPPLARHPERRVDAHALAASDRPKVKLREGQVVWVDGARMDLGAVEQIVESGQLHAIAWIARHYARELPDRGLGEALPGLIERLAAEGLDHVTSWPLGDLSLPRAFEVAAALNRLRP